MLRHRITLQSLTAGAWVDARTVWAEVTTEEGTNPLKHRIRVRYDRRIAADQRIVYRDSVLAMDGPPADLEGKRRELVMLCTATGESLHDTEEETVTARGAAVTITRVTQAHNTATHRLTATTATVLGHFEQREPNHAVYERLGLRETEAITGRFVPTTLGVVVQPGDTMPWGDFTWTAKDVDVEAPDGTAVACTVVWGR